MTPSPVFFDLIGNDSVKTYLAQMIEKKMPGQSYLFSGPSGVGKSRFALALAELLMTDGQSDSRIQSGSHPDVRQLRPEGKVAMHSIDSLRRFQDEVQLSPFESKKKVFIIHEADRMLPTSANALLKVFEEPPSDTTIILLSSQPEHLLSTVLSRCRRIFFQPLTVEEVQHWLTTHKSLNPEQAQKIATQSSGSLERALHLLEKGNDPLIESLLDHLKNGRFSHYPFIHQFATEIGQTLQEKKDELAEEAKKQLLPEGFDDFQATQKEGLLKEVDGAISCQYARYVDALLETIVSWFRDGLLLKNGGDPSLLRNPEDEELLRSTNMQNLRFSDVLEAVADARTNLQRFSPPASVFESLFLKLNHNF